jgi:hypothetical protein
MFPALSVHSFLSFFDMYNEKGCHNAFHCGCLGDRLASSCLCYTWPTSVVAASDVGALDVLTPEVEMIVSSVYWDGVLGSLENLGKRVLSHRSGHGRGFIVALYIL